MSAKPLDLRELAGASACLGLALLVHLPSLPVWITLTIAAAAAVRLILAWRKQRPPPQFLRLLVALLAISLLFAQFHTFNGISAGTALLALMAGLKLLEAKSPRDIGIIILIVYFLCLAALLAGTSLVLLLYIVVLSWLTTATLLRASVSAPQPDWPSSLRYSARMIALAIPLAGVLWLFFPRFAGPLWHLPDESPSTISGLTDRMTPGDLSELSLSDEVAFRVRFEAEAPPPRERYWRGPVLYDFDGRTWERGQGSFLLAPPLKATGNAYRYILSLEPHRHNWIFALDWPQNWEFSKAFLNRDYMLVQPERAARETDFAIESDTHAESIGPLGASLRRRNTRLPADRNPRTLELAAQLRSTRPDDLEYARAILDLFRQQAFYYTLTPPILAQNSVDEFLFDTKRGFCEHYASAFAALMRAAGIPARVVTGYQGGTFNRFAGYWIIRQSDAHAWNEAWIEGHGWVRFDPTAAIAPERIEQGSAAILGEAAAAGGRLYRWAPWLADVRLRIDALHEIWRRAILNFNSDAQMNLLDRMGIAHPDPQKLVLTLAIAFSMALAWLAWQVRSALIRRSTDPLLRGFARIERKLAAAGVPRFAHEGAMNYLRRLALARPDLAAATGGLLERYVVLRYGERCEPGAARAFEQASRKLRVKRRRP